MREKLKNLLKNRRWERFKRKLEEFHPFDVGEIVWRLKPTKKKELLDRLEPEQIAWFLQEIEEEYRQKEIMEILPDDVVVAILLSLPPDEATDILGLFSIEKRQDILERLPAKTKEQLESLLPFPPNTAGGLMTTEVLSLPAEASVEEAETLIKEKAREYETIYYLYVTDMEGKLIGVISMRELLLAPPSKSLREIMIPEVISVDVNMEQEQVANLVADYDLPVVPVVDDQKRLVGLVTVDDVVEVLEEEIVEDMGKIVGTKGEVDNLIDAPSSKVLKNRLPWLLVALIGDGVIASLVLRSFEETITSVIALSLFVPVIMTMGGNLGLQTSTIFIRGLAINEIKNKTTYLLRELQVGALMALISSVCVGIFSSWVINEPLIGIVVGVAMLNAMILASLLGIILPTLFERLGVDPAVASGPFMTTTLDITGLTVYFALATFLLQYIG